MEYRRLGSPPMNPFTRILAGLFGLVALVGAFFFGFLILAVAVAVGMVPVLGLGVVEAELHALPVTSLAQSRQGIQAVGGPVYDVVL